MCDLLIPLLKFSQFSINQISIRESLGVLISMDGWRGLGWAIRDDLFLILIEFLRTIRWGENENRAGLESDGKCNLMPLSLWGFLCFLTGSNNVLISGIFLLTPILGLSDGRKTPSSFPT
ncbi:hypothetical protein NE237_023681 [Protea cynaroides]|uniref:Uncharacterized protein n=1 Tax=Protea cynaroides TaxID=273540 RepID=A0A9Q0HC78_9MAGN|nr:hypothetical protein NE237_023681 [Protea cynaroides]